MISVALAAYKGEAYIEAQLRSILPQLSHDDEIIVSDDAPGGATERVVRRVMADDPRVFYVEGKGQGVVANFVNAIRHCRGDKIFLCDQDDVWLPDKVGQVMAAFDKGATLVLHNAYVTDKDLEITDYSFFALRGSQRGFFRNIIYRSDKSYTVFLTKNQKCVYDKFACTTSTIGFLLTIASVIAGILVFTKI